MIPHTLVIAHPYYTHVNRVQGRAAVPHLKVVAQSQLQDLRAEVDVTQVEVHLGQQEVRLCERWVMVQALLQQRFGGLHLT